MPIGQVAIIEVPQQKRDRRYTEDDARSVLGILLQHPHRTGITFEDEPFEEEAKARIRATMMRAAIMRLSDFPEDMSISGRAVEGESGFYPVVLIRPATEKELAKRAGAGGAAQEADADEAAEDADAKPGNGRRRRRRGAQEEAADQTDDTGDAS